MEIHIPKRLVRLKEAFKHKMIEWSLLIGIFVLIGLYYLTIFRIRYFKDSDSDVDDEFGEN